jgi:acetyl esterase
MTNYVVPVIYSSVAIISLIVGLFLIEPQTSVETKLQRIVCFCITKTLPLVAKRLQAHYYPIIPPKSNSNVLKYDILVPDIVHQMKHDIVARVFEPRGVKEPVKIILYFHGGSNVMGSARSEPYESILTELCQETKSIVIGVDYALAPDYRFPIAIYDAYSTLAYVNRIYQKKDHAFTARVDSSKVVLAGDEAGASIVIALARIAKTKQLMYLERYMRTEVGNVVPLNITLQVLIEPDIIETTKDYLNTSMRLQVTRNLYQSRFVENPMYQAIRYAQDSQYINLSDTVIMQSGNGLFRNGTEHYAGLLSQNGTKVTLKRYQGEQNFFVSDTKSARQARRDLIEIIKNI